MNTLYISYDGMTDPLGQSQVLPYLKGLAKAGYQITLISFEKEENKQRMSHITKLINDMGVEWHPLAYTKRPPILSTLWDIRQMRKLAFALHKVKKFRLVHCRSYLAAMIGQDLKKKFGTKFLFDMRGFWPDERVDGNVWDLDNPIFRFVYNFFKKKEKQFLKEADHIVSLTQNGKQVLEDQMKANVPVSVIPCCVDLELFKPSEDQSTTSKQNKELTIGYLGGIGTWYMLPEMLDFFKILLTKYPKAVFHFITREQPDTILRLAQEKQIPTEQLKIGAAHREEIPKMIEQWDCSIFFIKPVFSKRASSPTKQGEIMAMGVPIICNSGVGDTDYVIEKYQAGVLVREFSELAYQQTLESLHQTLTLPVENMMIGAKDFYSLSKGVMNYTQIYSTLIPN